MLEFLSYGYFHIPNFLLGALMYTCFGVFFGYIFPPREQESDLPHISPSCRPVLSCSFTAHSWLSTAVFDFIIRCVFDDRFSRCALHGLLLFWLAATIFIAQFP